ncbi:unnamed protein product [Moneuplotes crassus]|uniref:Uncharacterized protein n=1 Tax=Euplotes crassus TaxID=5936 RepID=A0AAD2D0L0_EUPCR|nr:unnamed protein product [Moneuplotes crassus]
MASAFVSSKTSCSKCCLFLRGLNINIRIKSRQFTHMTSRKTKKNCRPSSPKKKANVCKTKRVSKRRTRFICVTKNSVNYQTVIIVEGKKTYVGRYTLEVDAAITFDFYSLMLHNN